MPSQSRSREYRDRDRDRDRDKERDRNNDRDREREKRRRERDRERARDRDETGDREQDREYSSRRYREERIRRVTNKDDEDDIDEEYYRRQQRRRSSNTPQRRRQSRDYENAREVEIEVEEDEPMVARPHRSSRQPTASPRTRDSPRRKEAERDPGGRGKAKESPATSPQKKSHRDRDRKGHRRGDSRGPADGDGSPGKSAGAIRERRHRRQEEEKDDIDDDEDEARRQRQRRRREREIQRASEKHTSTDSTNSASQLLSADALAKLNAHYQRESGRERQPARPSDDEEQRRLERRRRRKEEQARDQDEGRRHSPKKTGKKRIVSGAIMEEGKSHEMKMKVQSKGGGLFSWLPGRKAEHDLDDDDDDDDNDDNNSDVVLHFQEKKKKRKKKILIGLGLVLLVLAIVIPVAVVVSKKSDSGNSSSSNGAGGGLTSGLNGINPDSIPASAKGTYLDPFTWLDTRDFNLTYTNATVGGLSVMGLNSTWDDSAQPNPNVPPLNQNFTYGTQPIRGVNLGGWLSLEPFITPSLFTQFPLSDGVIDEYTLMQQLGDSAAKTIEEHYVNFITEDDFAQIAQAGLDHVRIQYSYWAVKTYDGDPYLQHTSWRYLLRAIEYCRKYGLRVKLDLHGIPGSQNGWNHSGRQGVVGWLNGTDGDLNAQRSLEIHDQLSQFFAQPRYKNVVTIYGLVNEPKMLSLPIESVLNWTTAATELIQKNGVTAMIAFHDGFLNLSKWKYMLKNGPPNMLLDTHQYTIFNTGEICLTHEAKVNLVCEQWTTMLATVNSPTNGWGPTICGEFSQADTDCTQYLNNVGQGSRWMGSYNTGDADTSTLTPLCPTKTSSSESHSTGKEPCDCNPANGDPSSFSDDYKTWLQTYVEAQMSAYEQAYGWFYWTWQTESAPQWSYKQALANGFMPKLAYQPSFKCGDTVPSFGSLPETY